MFKKVIGRKCLTQSNPPCPLHGQMQDRGFSICPECAGELTPIYQTDWPKTLFAYGICLLLIGVSSLFAVGMSGKHLNAAQTLLWALQRIHLRDRLASETTGQQFFGGSIISEGSSGPARSSDFLYSEVEGQPHCLWRYPSRDGDLIHFELSSMVPYAYVLHRGSSQSLFVAPRNDEISKVPEGGQVRAPMKENLRLAGGAGIEHFVLIFGTREISELENQLKAGSISTDSLDRLTVRLAKDPEYAVLHVEVPHT